jgi:hypothetical protein
MYLSRSSICGWTIRSDGHKQAPNLEYLSSTLQAPSPALVLPNDRRRGLRSIPVERRREQQLKCCEYCPPTELLLYWYCIVPHTTRGFEYINKAIILLLISPYLF